MTHTALRRYEELVANDRKTLTIAEDDEYYYDAIPMLYNWRLVMTPKDNQLSWDYGWCFAGPIELRLAMLAWDPETQNEPLGWKKRPTGIRTRTAPRADEDPSTNRPRCVHGHYPDDGPCETDPFCGVHDR